MKDDYDLFNDEEGKIPKWLTFLLSAVVAILGYSLFAVVLYLVWKSLFHD